MRAGRGAEAHSAGVEGDVDGPDAPRHDALLEEERGETDGDFEAVEHDARVAGRNRHAVEARDAGDVERGAARDRRARDLFLQHRLGAPPNEVADRRKLEEDLAEDGGTDENEQKS